MTKRMSDEEILAIVQAAMESNEIQQKAIRWHDSGVWAAARRHEDGQVSWDFDSNRYRVKPEPRELWEGWVVRRGDMKPRVFEDEILAREFCENSYLSLDCIVHVREVLECDNG